MRQRCCRLSSALFFTALKATALTDQATRGSGDSDRVIGPMTLLKNGGQLSPLGSTYGNVMYSICDGAQVTAT